MRMKIISVWLVLLLSFSVFSPVFSAYTLDSGSCGPSLTWVLTTDGTLTVSGFGRMDSYSADKTPWSGAIKKVVIEDGVTSIGAYAFFHFSDLESVSIPKSVVSIGEFALTWCNLSSVQVAKENPVYHSAGNCLIETATKTLILGTRNSVVPADGSVTVIGDNAFDNVAVDSVYLSEHIKRIGDYAFYQSPIKTLVMDGVISIGKYAFVNTHMDHIQFSDSLISIGEAAFHNSGYNRITFPGSVVSIGSAAFFETNIRQLIICDGVGSIESTSFYMSNIEELVISSSVSYIGKNALVGGRVRRVYYCGSAEDWKKIKREGDDLGEDSLKNARFCYNYSPVRKSEIYYFVMPGMTGDMFMKWTVADMTIETESGTPLGREKAVGSGNVVCLPDGSRKTVLVHGDTSGDGAVTAADARFVLRCAVGMETPNVWQKAAGMLVSEERLSAADARAVLRAAVGLDVIYP